MIFTNIDAVKNNKNVSYENLVEEHLNAMGYYTQNKETGEIKKVFSSDNKWGRNGEMLLLQNIFTENLKSVYDFCGGKRNKESYNFIIDLQNETLIDNIRFISAKSYYPTVMNYYVGSDFEEMFAENNAPVKSYTEVQNKGIYDFKFEPRFARYVRIEVIDSINTYYGDMLVIPVAFLGVFGYKGVYSDDFSKNIKNILKNTKTKPVTLLQPYLYKDRDGWSGANFKKTDDGDLKGIDLTEVGEGYYKTEAQKGSLINIGLTDDPSMVSFLRKGVNFAEYADVYFYIHSSVKGEISFQIVSVYDNYFNSYLTVREGWQRFNLRGIMSDGRYAGFSSDNPDNDFKRLAVYPWGKYDGEITVGSIIANRYVDWSALGMDLDATDGWSVDKWLETIEGLDLSNAQTDELDAYLGNFKNNK